MLRESDCLLCYDGTIEGFFTAVFEAYALHVRPADIQASGLVQPALGQEIIDVACDASKAERVRVGICNKGGYKAYELVKHAFLSCVQGREMAIFSYIALVMKEGRRVCRALDNPIVAKVERLALAVVNETEDIRQFARFELMESGIYVAVVNPKAHVVPLVMSYFAGRFNTQPFVIYDEVHHVAGVHDMRRHYLMEVEDFVIPDRAACEETYQQMWKTFYDCASNVNRFNPDLRRQHMPQRFWRNLTEMKLAL